MVPTKPLVAYSRPNVRVDTTAAVTVRDVGFVSPEPLVIATVYVPAGSVIVNVPVDPTPEANVTGVLVIVPPDGVTVTVTVTGEANDPLAAMV